MNGYPVASGSPSQSIDLEEGETETIEIVVTSEDGTNSITYFIYVYRNLSQERLYPATLSSITLSAGSFDNEFDPYTWDYFVTVPYEVESITVTPVASVETATINVEGFNVASGTPSQSINLIAGYEYWIMIWVTAEDGTENLYSIYVTREELP